ncbi:hypothetical protein, partial [Meiothermus sp.]|uniref:hypothetical protein n=1 Tax=Meiothermus sp. TaxID=1955249 RepID=UPI0025DB19D8
MNGEPIRRRRERFAALRHRRADRVRVLRASATRWPGRWWSLPPSTPTRCWPWRAWTGCGA